MKTSLFTDKAGVCKTPDEGKPDPNLPPYNCSNKFLPYNKDQWLTLLPCPFYTKKCGSPTQLLNLTGESLNEIKGQMLAQGDVCMFQFHYEGVDK